MGCVKSEILERLQEFEANKENSLFETRNISKSKCRLGSSKIKGKDTFYDVISECFDSFDSGNKGFL